MAEPEKPTSGAADNPEKPASGVADIGFGRDSQGRLVMRLQIVRGSFLTAEEDCPMDEAVWSKMPEDILWVILRFLPVAKHFQLQLVSRKWRQVLTSADFRKELWWFSPRTKTRVVACVSIPKDGDSGSSSSGRKMKVVDIDLSFVPESFWKAELAYSVMGVGSGLVCISNDYQPFLPRPDQWKENRFCVLNLVTRTCQVLPDPPFKPKKWLFLSTIAVVIVGSAEHDWEEFRVATCGLITDGYDRSDGWTTDVQNAVNVHAGWLREAPVLVLSGGHMYWFDFQYRAVREVAPRAGGLLLDVAPPVNGPSVAQLGLDPDAVSIAYGDNWVRLVAHRGNIYVLAQLFKNSQDVTLDYTSNSICGLWRLVWRGRKEWERVALLGMAEVERVTGWRCMDGKRSYSSFELLTIIGVYGVRELLCCQALVRKYLDDDCSKLDYLPVVLGFNLDKGEWELVHKSEEKLGSNLCVEAKPVELRPDVFIFGTGDHSYQP